MCRRLSHLWVPRSVSCFLNDCLDSSSSWCLSGRCPFALTSRWGGMAGHPPTLNLCDWVWVSRTALWQPLVWPRMEGLQTECVRKGSAHDQSYGCFRSLLVLLGLSLSSLCLSRMTESLQVSHKSREASFHQSKENSRRCLIQAFLKTPLLHPQGAVETPLIGSRGALPSDPFPLLSL